MTSFTKRYHHKPYPLISPFLPSNSCQGKTVLISGASECIGYAIARAFTLAQASRIILVSRRLPALESAITTLSTDADINLATEFIPISADVFDDASIRQLWQTLKDRTINVDGLVLNAAKTRSNGEIDEELSTFAANITANVLMMDFFLHKQLNVSDANGHTPSESKFLINISSMAAHWNPTWPGYEAYCASKAGFASYVQHIASKIDARECLMVNIHPGAVYTPAAGRNGVTRDALVWDDPDLTGSFCVWVSKQTFLHGRFLWINWDAEELIALKPKILDDPGMLKIGLQGVESVDPNRHFKTLFERQQRLANTSP